MDNVKSAEVTVNTADLPIYPGIALADVLLVDDQHKAAAALEALSAETALGFDTESKPTFLKGKPRPGRIWCNWQACIGPFCSRSL